MMVAPGIAHRPARRLSSWSRQAAFSSSTGKPDEGRGVVPRFYFDVTAGPTFIPDEEGFELDSLDAAEREATQALIQLGRDWLPRVREVRIQVRDEKYRQVLALSVAIRIERLDHLLEPAWIQESR
jgi:hypothetical protein